MNFWCYDNHSWKSEGSSHNITANLMNTSPPVFQPVHPALIWPFQKLARFVSRDASQLMRCCHRTAQGWLGDWRYGLPLYRAVTLQSCTKTALQSVGTPLAHPDRERWWRRYVTLLQTVQIEAHYVAELAMQKRWLKANCHDWTRPGLPFCFKWANLRGINDRQKHPMEPTTILMRIYSIRVD